MLSGQEQRVWDDIRQSYEAEAEEPARARPGGAGGHPASLGVDDLPAGVVAGVWIAILLLAFGAPVLGLTVALVTALGWLAWRRPAQLVADRVAPKDPRRDDDDDRTRAPR